MRYPKFALSCLFKLSVFLGTKIDRKRYQKFNQKSITNPPNIYQKSMKINQKSFKIEAGAALGVYQDVLVVSWGILPRFGRVLRRLGSVLGDVLAASWDVLGVSWGALGCSWGLLGRLGGVLGLIF